MPKRTSRADGNPAKGADSAKSAGGPPQPPSGGPPTGSRLKQQAKTLIGVLFLGVLTNGLWERLFRPLWDSLLASGPSWLDALFLDNIYSEAARGQGMLTLVSIIGSNLLCSIAGALMIGWLRLKEDIDEIAGGPSKESDLSSRWSPEVELRMVRRGHIALGVIGGAYFVLAIAGLVGAAAAVETLNNFSANQAILRSKASPEEDRELLAAFASIKSRSEFRQVEHRQGELAKKYKVTLRQW